MKNQWPIWINDYAGKSHEVPLDVGDMCGLSWNRVRTLER